MLILGLLAMSVIGGLALYLANRKTGDVSTVSQTITTSETTNTFFSQLIATGITSGADLADISTIRPYGEGFVGLSKETLTEAGAVALAEKTGAKILEIPSQPVLEIHPPISWLQQNFVSGEILRVVRNGKPHLLVGETILPASDPVSPHRALLHWIPQKPSPEQDTLQPQPGIKESEPEITPPVVEEPDNGTNGTTPEVETPPQPAPGQPEPVPTLDNWTDTQGREIQAIFLRVEAETLVINFKEKETRIPLSRLSEESRALAMKRQAEMNP